jgi:GH25 family lysozyme M1 (1,4-beta-N-acetylmuramidase)
MSHRYAVVAALTLAVVLGPLGVGSSRAAANPLARAASAPLTQASTYLEGIDVSHWNGTINWPQVAGAGKTFAIIKATEGETFLDSMYATNHSGARAAGLRTTAYHFARPGLPTSEATIQADWFVQNAALLPGDLVPALDLEDSGGLSTTDLQSWVLAWLTEVNAKLGVKAMIYTNPSFWQTYMGRTTMFADQGYTLLWIAHWFVSSPNVPANNWGGHGWTFWQYDDCGTVAGISSGCVDLDRYNGTDFTPVTFGTTFVPLAPVRLLDSRSGNGLSGAFSSHVARTFGVAGRGGVPANATAVTGNLTVTAQTAGGYLYLGPGATNNPTSSTLNFPVADDRANGVTVALGAEGTLSATYVATTLGPTAQVIFDVTGYFTPDTSDRSLT